MFLVHCSKLSVLEVSNHSFSLAFSVITPTASIINYSSLILHYPPFSIAEMSLEFKSPEFAPGTERRPARRDLHGFA